ncbi:hypothetical protein Acr_00g0086610 [Actinidia rufa]|uniref:Uncharacterized protein n=1 Tax=Actinidia rufa TaxID=165716 RepID=A0A7J0DX07_9ERIC|nr:hypothetical protein Acr_00g0086610 [Actinidia rufa]
MGEGKLMKGQLVLARPKGLKHRNGNGTPSDTPVSVGIGTMRGRSALVKGRYASVRGRGKGASVRGRRAIMGVQLSGCSYASTAVLKFQRANYLLSHPSGLPLAVAPRPSSNAVILPNLLNNDNSEVTMVLAQTMPVSSSVCTGLRYREPPNLLHGHRSVKTSALVRPESIIVYFVHIQQAYHKASDNQDFHKHFFPSNHRHTCLQLTRFNHQHISSSFGTDCSGEEDEESDGSDEVDEGSDGSGVDDDLNQEDEDPVGESDEESDDSGKPPF